MKWKNQKLVLLIEKPYVSTSELEASLFFEIASKKIAINNFFIREKWKKIYLPEERVTDLEKSPSDCTKN